MDLSDFVYKALKPQFQKSDIPPASAKNIDIEIWKWHNKIRTDPRSLIPELEAMMEYFDEMKYNGKNLKIDTKEGKNSVLDLI